MRAIQCDRFGPPGVLRLVEVPAPPVEEGQLLITVSAAGVNFADTSRIGGTYQPAPDLPFVPGTEVVGRTADGRRVLAFLSEGGFAEQAVAGQADAVEVPDSVGDGEALALLVQGLTAWHVLRNSARIRPGDSVVVTAAAGGVGSLAIQLAKHFGAGRVIAAASTPAKRDVAVRLGADAAVTSDPSEFADQVLDANHGRAVDIVLDSIGGAIFTASLDILAPFGRVITFGNASRQGRPLVDTDTLGTRNTAVAGFWLRPVLARPGAYREPLTEMFALLSAGLLTPLANTAYPLADAPQALEALLTRRTTGKIILRP